jgi:hypothetical protein
LTVQNLFALEVAKYLGVHALFRVFASAVEVIKANCVIRRSASQSTVHKAFWIWKTVNANATKVGPASTVLVPFVQVNVRNMELVLRLGNASATKDGKESSATSLFASDNALSVVYVFRLEIADALLGGLVKIAPPRFVPAIAVPTASASNPEPANVIHLGLDSTATLLFAQTTAPITVFVL